jgi:hypothetical protein
MKTARVSIRQTTVGWDVLYDDAVDDVPTTFGSAAEALAAVRKSDAMLARAGVSTVRVVDWYPRTKLGRIVVEALQ